LIKNDTPWNIHILIQDTTELSSCLLVVVPSGRRAFSNIQSHLWHLIYDSTSSSSSTVAVSIVVLRGSSGWDRQYTRHPRHPRSVRPNINADGPNVTDAPRTRLALSPPILRLQPGPRATAAASLSSGLTRYTFSVTSWHTVQSGLQIRADVHKWSPVYITSMTSRGVTCQQLWVTYFCFTEINK